MGSSYKNVSPRRSLVLIEEPCNDWLNILNLYDICKNKNQTPYGAAHKRFRHTRARCIWECWYRTAPSIQATPEPPPEVRQAPCQGSKPPFLSDGLPPRWQTEDVKEKSFKTFSILFKYYQRHRCKLFRVISQVDQNSASEARPNISFKSWAKHGQNIAHMSWAKLRFRFLTQIQHEISSIFSLDLSSELQLQTIKETSAIIIIEANTNIALQYKDHWLALSIHLHWPESHQGSPLNRS